MEMRHKPVEAHQYGEVFEPQDEEFQAQGKDVMESARTQVTEEKKP